MEDVIFVPSDKARDGLSESLGVAKPISLAPGLCAFILLPCSYEAPSV